MTDAELELHISSLAILIEKAMVEGDTAGARAWAAARAEAEQGRQHLLDIATLDRIEHQNECYFDAIGEFHSQITQRVAL